MSIGRITVSAAVIGLVVVAAVIDCGCVVIVIIIHISIKGIVVLV